MISPEERERMAAAEPPEQPLALAESHPARRRLPKKTPYHEEIAPELADDLHLYVGMGLALAAVGEGLPPRAIVDAIAKRVDALCDSGQTDEDDSDARLALACAYGHQLCRELGWSWAHVRRTKRPGIVLMSRDTRYVVAPRALVDAAIDSDPRRGAALWAYVESLRAPELLPNSAPGRYLRLQF